MPSSNAHVNMDHGDDILTGRNMYDRVWLPFFHIDLDTECRSLTIAIFRNSMLKRCFLISDVARGFFSLRICRRVVERKYLGFLNREGKGNKILIVKNINLSLIIKTKIIRKLCPDK